jgi:hypothetical protein
MEKRFLKPGRIQRMDQHDHLSATRSMNETSMHNCIIEDITTKREALEALRESERSKSF